MNFSLANLPVPVPVQTFGLQQVPAHRIGCSGDTRWRSFRS